MSSVLGKRPAIIKLFKAVTLTIDDPVDIIYVQAKKVESQKSI